MNDPLDDAFVLLMRRNPANSHRANNDFEKHNRTGFLGMISVGREYVGRYLPNDLWESLDGCGISASCSAISEVKELTDDEVAAMASKAGIKID